MTHLMVYFWLISLFLYNFPFNQVLISLYPSLGFCTFPSWEYELLIVSFLWMDFFVTYKNLRNAGTPWCEFFFLHYICYSFICLSLLYILSVFSVNWHMLCYVLLGCLDPENFKQFKLVKRTQLSHNVAKFRFDLPTPTSVLGLPIGQHISCKYGWLSWFCRVCSMIKLGLNPIFLILSSCLHSIFHHFFTKWL